MPDAALVERIRGVLAASPFHGEGHRKVWARLRMAGVRTSKQRVLRLMREHDLLAPSRVGSPRGPRNHDGTIIPEALDTMWGTDMTTTWTGEGQVAVFIAIDHSQRRVRRHPCGPARHPLRGAGAAASGHPPPFRCLRQGRGARPRHPARSRQPLHGSRFPGELTFLGAESSPAFVRAPEGNGCAERFIRTLKENLLWVQSFDTLEALRQALLAFRETYNTTWLIERLGFQSPAAARQARLSPAALAA